MVLDDLAEAKLAPFLPENALDEISCDGSTLIGSGASILFNEEKRRPQGVGSLRCLTACLRFCIAGT